MRAPSCSSPTWARAVWARTRISWRRVLFLASLVGQTKQIRLGTGTVNLPNTHPARVAGEIAMLDHLLDGRLNFGISPGGLPSDAEAFGTLGADRNAMFVEAIDQVLQIWASEPPYNIVGKYWSVTTQKTLIADIGQGIIPKPLQAPHPPIVVTVVAPFSKAVTQAAARGWEPISANFLMPQWVRSHWPGYVEGCKRGGRPADPVNWRIAKSICVADQEFRLATVEPACLVEFGDGKLGSANLVGCLGAVGAGEWDGEADLDRAVLRTKDARQRQRAGGCTEQGAASDLVSHGPFPSRRVDADRLITTTT
jgi:alkanesulfonate monooxygenase SsuD/methylene tetrahydromethanopterin reductase-like flavin-dependent oxidoreductase (luciferase family)